MATQLTDLYQFNTVSGTIMPDTSAIKDMIVADFRDVVFKADIDTTQETNMGRLIDWLAVAFASIVKLNAANGSQLNFDYATGQFLDALGALFGLYRKAASHTTVPVTLTGTAGATVPAGTTARTEAGDVFALMETVIIGDDGTTDDPLIPQPYFRAIEPGPVPCAYGELNIIDAAVVGWTGITNAEGVTGAYLESDDDFRARIAGSRYAGDGSLSNIYRNVAAVDPGISCLVYENDDLPDRVLNGVVVKGHSIYVCVDGIGDDDAMQEAVAKAIFASKPVGCGYTTTVNGAAAPTMVSVLDEESGIAYPVYFYKPAHVTPQVNVTFSRGSYTGASVKADVTEVVTGYVNSMKIGESLSSFNLGMAIAKAVPGIVLHGVSFESTEDPGFTVYSYQKAVMNAAGNVKFTEVA